MTLDEIIVAKFGGSSVARPEDFRDRVIPIIQSDPRRRIIVLSAPGKCKEYNWKITDGLKDIALQYNSEGKFAPEKRRFITERMKEYVKKLGIYSDKKELGIFMDSIKDTITSRLEEQYPQGRGNSMRLDAVMVYGEELQGMIAARYCTEILNAPSLFLNSSAHGLRASAQFGKGRWLPSSRQKIRMALLEEECIMFPCGYGALTSDDEIVTLGRNGSDITGAIDANAVDAIVYENWTDMDGIMAVHPSILSTARTISVMNYSEAKELTLMDFGRLHKDAIDPCQDRCIPILVKNTFHPEVRGTMILGSAATTQPVTGISHRSGYIKIEVDFVNSNGAMEYDRDLFSAIVENNAKDFLLQRKIPVDVTEPGHDGFTMLVHRSYISDHAINDLFRHLIDQFSLSPHSFEVDYNYSIINVVGRGMRDSCGFLGEVATEIGRQKISIDITSQRGKQISIYFGFKEAGQYDPNHVPVNASRAVNALYEKFLRFQE